MAETATLSPNSIINLSRAAVLVVDENPFCLRLMAQVLSGFGVKQLHECNSAKAAVDLLETMPIDLVFIDSDLGETDGYDLTSWLRRSNIENNAYTPVIMTGGHTKARKVKKARDCGANFIVARPFSPMVLLERIVWVAKDNRSFLDAGDYVGPDRRFKEEPPPASGDRRAQTASSPPRNKLERVG